MRGLLMPDPDPRQRRRQADARSSVVLDAHVRAHRLTSLLRLASGEDARFIRYASHEYAPTYLNLYRRSRVIAAIDGGVSVKDAARLLSVPLGQVTRWLDATAHPAPDVVVDLAADSIDRRVLATFGPGLRIPVAGPAAEALLRGLDYYDDAREIAEIMELHAHDFARLTPEEHTGVLFRLTGRRTDKLISPSETLPGRIRRLHQHGAVLGMDGARFVTKEGPATVVGCALGNPERLMLTTLSTERSDVAEWMVRTVLMSNDGAKPFLVVVFDGHKSYFSNRFRAFLSLMDLVPFPIECPAQNPIERVWRRLRERMGDTSGLTLLEFRRELKLATIELRQL